MAVNGQLTAYLYEHADLTTPIASTTNVLAGGQTRLVNGIGSGYAVFPRGLQFYSGSTPLYLNPGRVLRVVMADSHAPGSSVTVALFVIRQGSKTVTNQPTILRAEGEDLLSDFARILVQSETIDDGAGGLATDDIDTILVHAPAWSVTYIGSGPNGTETGTYHNVREQKLIQLLLSAAEQSGEYFILNPSSDRNLIWQRSYTDAGVSAASLGQMVSGIPILEIQAVGTGEGGLSRAYVYGAGSGDDRFTFTEAFNPTQDSRVNLRGMTRSGNMLINDLIELNGYPVTTDVLTFSEIEPTDYDDPDAVKTAAVTLVNAAAIAMEKMSDWNTAMSRASYTLKCILHQEVRPMQKVTVLFDDDAHDIHLDGDFIITQVQHSSDGPQRMTSLQLSPVGKHGLLIEGEQAIARSLAGLIAANRRGTTAGGAPPAAVPTDHDALSNRDDINNHTQYLPKVGGTMTGNIVMAVGATVDGTDISAHVADANAHHNAATAGDGISLTGQQVAVDGTVVRTTRTLTAGNGLIGGGDLDANRTFDVGAGDGISVAADAVSVDSTVVRTSRLITAGTGLSGGGSLAADRTIDVNYGDGLDIAIGNLLYVDMDALVNTNQGLQVVSNDVGIKLASPSGLTFNGTTGGLELAAAVAGAGLTLTSQVLAVGAGDGLDVAAGSIAVDVTDLIGIGLDEDASNNLILGTPSALTVSTTNSVSGTTHTHAITASSNPGIASSLLKSDSSGDLRLQNMILDGTLTVDGEYILSQNDLILTSDGEVIIDNDLKVTGIIYNTGNLTIAPTSTLTLSPTIATILQAHIGSSIIPYYTDTYDLGDSTHLWRKGWLSELESILFVENSVQVLGGWFMIPHSQNVLINDMDAVTATFEVAGDLLQVGDFLLLRGNLAVEYMQVTAEVVAGETYTVTRNVDGSGANAWTQGQVWVNLGQSGDGRIEFDAQTAGPRISVIAQGTAYNAQDEYVRLGDLTNWEGAGLTEYGIALGDYSGSYLYYTPTSGLVIAASGGGITNINGDNITTGTIAAERVDLSDYLSVSAGQAAIDDLYNTILSRGENLVTNGTGTLGDLTNFSYFDYFDAANLVSGGGSFAETTYAKTNLSDELIAIDPARRYRGDMYIKNITSGYAGKFYFGLAPYDSDQLNIDPRMILWTANTETTLAAALNPSDTTIQLTDSTNWVDNQGAGSHYHSFNWWPYTNGAGYTYPDYTYSRNIRNTYGGVADVGVGAWDNSAINHTTHIITLSTTKFPSGWTGPTLPAGTPIVNAHSGGSYIYCFAQNKTIPDDWTQASELDPTLGYIEGIVTAGTQTNTEFWQGTAFVKLLWLLNRDVATNAGCLINNIVFELDYESTRQQVLDWGHANDATLIDGGNIYTGSIFADAIAANQITSSHIQADAITATHINVTTLSAISADMGSLTAGYITGGTIRTAASGARIELNGTKIFGTDGTTTQWQALASSGKISAGAGGVEIGADGIVIIDSRKLSFQESSTVIGEIGVTESGNVRLMTTGGTSANLITDPDLTTGDEWNDGGAGAGAYDQTYLSQKCGYYSVTQYPPDDALDWYSDWITISGDGAIVRWMFAGDIGNLATVEWNAGSADPDVPDMTHDGSWNTYEIFTQKPSGATAIRLHFHHDYTGYGETHTIYVANFDIRSYTDQYALLDVRNTGIAALQAAAQIDLIAPVVTIDDQLLMAGGYIRLEDRYLSNTPAETSGVTVDEFLYRTGASGTFIVYKYSYFGSTVYYKYMRLDTTGTPTWTHATSLPSP